MAKKNKRSVTIEPTNTAGVTSSPAFDPDYTPIIRDLRRIGILAGTFVTVLVVLSFFLR